jgi:tripartite-type tricarboxylate transporter receptor subunit TctC
MINKLLTVCAMLAFITSSAFADNYPSKSVKIIVPFAAGGPADNYARFMAQRLQDEFKQTFLVENKPGAGSIIGTDFAAKSPADGYSMLMMSNTQTVNESLVPNKPFNLMRDFVGVAPINFSDLVLVVNPSVPVKTLAELIQLAKSKPGKLNFASSGNGLAPHLSGEVFRVMAGIDVVHIPYNGSPPAMLAVLNGDASYMFQILPTALTYIKSGKIRALAITSPKRSILLPEVPTVAESGLPKFEWLAWFGISAPAGTPKEIIAKLNMAIVKALKTPEVEERLLSQGIEPLASSPEQFNEYIKAETLRWNNFVKVSGFKKNF